jgi:hypothetical protein
MTQATSKHPDAGAPKLAQEKIDVYLPGELKERLAIRANQEKRSSSAQAVFFIESGLNNPDPSGVPHALASIEAKLDDVLRLLRNK